MTLYPSAAPPPAVQNPGWYRRGLRVGAISFIKSRLSSHFARDICSQTYARVRSPVTRQTSSSKIPVRAASVCCLAHVRSARRRDTIDVSYCMLANCRPLHFEACNALTSRRTTHAITITGSLAAIKRMHTSMSHEILLDSAEAIAIHASVDYLSFGNNLLVHMVVDCLAYLGAF